MGPASGGADRWGEGWVANGVGHGRPFTGRPIFFENDDGDCKSIMKRPRDTSNHSSFHRVIASLNRAQVDYLDKLGKDAQFSSGLKLSRTEILAAMVNALKRLNLTGEGITTAEQFEQRIVDAMMGRARTLYRAGTGRAGKGTGGGRSHRNAHGGPSAAGSEF